MLDITTMEKEQQQLLAGMYLHAMLQFRAAPERVSAKRKRKIRRWLERSYSQPIRDLPDEIGEGIFAAAEDEAVIDLLREAYLCLKDEESRQERQFRRTAAGLGPEMADALWALRSLTVWPKTQLQEDRAVLELENEAAFCRTLTLTQVRGLFPEWEGWPLGQAELTFQEDTGRYCFHGQLEDPETQEQTAFALWFTAGEVSVECYDCTRDGSNWPDPWQHLSWVATSILEKRVVQGGLNQREQEQLPLLLELESLCYPDWLEGSGRFPLLRDRLAARGLTKPLARLDKLEQSWDTENREWQAAQLNAELCRQPCEGLWRELHDEIAAGQEAYPGKAERYWPREELNAIRADVQRQMEELGFSGQYPDFVRCGPLKGIHLTESYNMSYFVGMEKRGVYRVRCLESVSAQERSICFLCGTAFLKKNELETDLWSCLFDAQGKRLFRTVYYKELREEPSEEYVPDDLEQKVTIAAKRAQLLPLTKTEQTAVSEEEWPVWAVFLFNFLLFGGLFSILMIPGMVLIAVLVTLLLGEGALIPEVLAQMPWLQLFIFCWVGSGGLMGLVTVLAKRK